MKNYKIYLSILVHILGCSLSSFAQQPPYNFPHPTYNSLQYLPDNVDLHSLASNPFNAPWKLVFEENFSTNASFPDFSAYTDKWVIKDGEVDDGKPHIFFWSPQRVFMQNGACYMKCTQTSSTINNTFYPYVSGGIYTKVDYGAHTGLWENGMFEIKMKMSTAYWGHDNMWPTSDNRGEIDACEMSTNKKRIPHHMHGPKVFPTNYDPDWDQHTTLNEKAYEHFHTYTAIWDKYFIYLLVDHNISNMKVLPKLKDMSGQLWPIGTTLSGYYKLTGSFIAINNALWVVIDQAFDSKWNNIGNPLDLITGQNAGLPGYTVVDWFKVYQLDSCYQDQTITSPTLFPYATLNEKSITLGTNALPNTMDLAWQSVSTHLDFIKYRAAYIDVRDNFLFDPHLAAVTNNLEFTARECPENKGIENEYWLDTTEFVDTIAPPYIFSCADIDTAAIDSILNGSDTDLINTIFAALDSIGCDYATTLQSRPGKDSNEQGRYADSARNKISNKIEVQQGNVIELYPNPNSGTFTIRNRSRKEFDVYIADIVGVVVYRATLKSQLVSIVDLGNNLPAGTYIVHVVGDGINYLKKITIIK